MAPDAPRIFVVDDDASVRRSLTRLLTSASYAVEAFPSAGAFLARERYAGPCCLLLDVRMPGLTGLDLQEALASAGRRMSIVFVTGHVDVPGSVRAMKHGAVDLLTKPVDEQVLLAAVQRALTKDLRDRAAEARLTSIQERARTLTPRETEVFALVVAGMLNKQIAFDLGVSEKTIKVHRARVMEKMRAGSVTELVRLADGMGVVVPGS